MKKLIALIICVSTATVSNSQILSWSQQYGTSTQATQTGESITELSNGDIISTGKIFGIIDFDNGPATYTVGLGANTAASYIMKTNANGQLIWAYAFTQFRDCKVSADALGNFYLAASTNSAVDMNPLAGTLNTNGINDYHIVKYDGNCNPIWLKSVALPSLANQNIFDVKCAPSGSFVALFATLNAVNGSTVDLNPDALAVNTFTLGGFTDLMYVALDVNGNYLHGYTNNDGGYEYYRSADVSSSGRIMIGSDESSFTSFRFRVFNFSSSTNPVAGVGYNSAVNNAVGVFTGTNSFVVLTVRNDYKIIKQEYSIPTNSLIATTTISAGWNNSIRSLLKSDNLGNLYLANDFISGSDFKINGTTLFTPKQSNDQNTQLLMISSTNSVNPQSPVITFTAGVTTYPAVSKINAVHITAPNNFLITGGFDCGFQTPGNCTLNYNALSSNNYTNTAFSIGGILFNARYTNTMSTVGNNESFINKEQLFEIYPNPTKSLINIISLNKLGTIKLINILGAELLSFEINETKLTIDLANLQSGVYFIKQGSTLKKFIKD